nr:TonB-dependent receptor plug domain-containing protein [uncultured Carboxylicivirga sp.]
MLHKLSSLLNNRSINCCLTILFVLFSQILYSQNSLDSVVLIKAVEVKANYIFKQEEAGMKITEMDSMVLQNKTTASLADLLTQNSTVYIKSQGRGALSTASFRGTAPTHTQVTWNGLNMNSPMLGMVDFSTIPVYVLDDVAIKYGSASISQSSGALGGSISLNNTADWNNRFSAMLLQGIGSFSTFDNMLRVDLGSDKLQSKTRMYRSSSENNYPFINKHLPGYPEVKNDNGDYSKLGFVQEFYYRWEKPWVSSAKIWAQDGTRSIPMVMSYEGNEDVKRSNQQDDKTIKGVVDTKYYGNNLQLNFRSGIDYQQLDYVMRIDVSGFGEQKPVNSGSDMLSSQNNIEAKYSFNDKLHVKASADIDYYNITCLDSAQMKGYDEERVEYSGFVGAYFTPGKWMNLLLELRNDWIPQTESPLVYNIGVSVIPFEGIDFVWRSNLARNFHAPTLNDLYYVPGGNPGLVPEEGHTIETGVHQVLNCSSVKIDYQVSAYYSDINNWILWLPSNKGGWEAFNLKNVLSRGVEVNLSLSKQIGNCNLQVQGNYAYTKTNNEGEPLNNEDASMGMQLPFIPLHSANALVGGRYKNFFVNYQFQYYGERYLLSSNMETIDDDSNQGLDYPYYKLYAVPLNHMSLGYGVNIGKVRLNTELKIHNLFDETYRNILNRFMSGRYYECVITLKL